MQPFITKKPKLLLHSCCGPCSTVAVERLADEYSLTIYFFNPNITDEEEYMRRRASQQRFLELFNIERDSEDSIEMIEGAYDPNVFYRCTKGLEGEPEGGKRCKRCFELRISETARLASKMNFDCFDTVLTTSPHKNYAIISEMGKRFADSLGVEFTDNNFKKKTGFQRSVELAKKYDLYRQNYCGCEFSKQT